MIAQIAETPPAFVYKVDAPQGRAALKLYKHIGWSGEGASLPFLRDLNPGVGVRVFRSDALRAAMLLEWLDGPTLGELRENDQEQLAITHIAAVAKGVHSTRFRKPFIYPRLGTKLARDFRKRNPLAGDEGAERLITRAADLLDHLIATTNHEHIIHGDLGFENVILTKDGPRLIDPKALRVDPAAEFAKFLVSPLSGVSPAEFIDRTKDRSEQLCASVAATPQRLIQWAAVVLGHRVLRVTQDGRNARSLQTYLAALLDMADR